MASLSATIVTFQPLCKASISNISEGGGKVPSIVTLGWANSRFPNLRTARRSIICAAKPETVDKVCAIVKKQLALAPDVKVTAATTFTELGADSLDTVEIVMALEEEFGITMAEESSQNISNIEDAAEAIEALMKGGA